MKKFFAFAFQMNQLDIVEWTTRLRAVDMLVGKEWESYRYVGGQGERWKKNATRHTV